MRRKILFLAVVFSIPIMFNSCKDGKEETVSITKQISEDDAFISFLTDVFALKILANEADPQLVSEGISEINSGNTPDFKSNETLAKAYATMTSIGINIHEMLDRYPALSEISDEARSAILLEAAGIAILPAGAQRPDPSLASQADLCTNMHNLAALGFLIGDIICFTDQTIPEWLCALIHELGQWVLIVLDDLCHGL